MTNPLRVGPELARDSGVIETKTSHSWEVYAEGVRFLALRSLGDQDAAKDASQETMLRAWRSTTERQGEPINDPVAFIYGIARHVIADAQRARVNTVSLELAPPIQATADNALDALVSAEERERVRRAISRLPRADRELLELSYLTGLTSAAIAAKLGESADSVRKRKSRALQRIRAAFSPE